MPEIILSARCYVAPLGILSYPFQFLPALLTCYSGQVTLLCLSPKLLEGVRDVSQWLSGKDLDNFEGQFGRVLNAGDSIWVPPLYTVAYMGVPPTPGMGAYGKTGSLKASSCTLDSWIC